MNKSFPLSLAALSAFTAPALFGADDDLVVLEPVTVTATRFDTDSLSVPASISVIGRDSILSTAATNVADLLGDLGISMRSYTGNPAQSMIDTRGFGEMGNLNVLVLVDNRRINLPDMSSVNWLGLPLAGVDKIEYIRGSQSALYGNNSAGGVLKITTAIPTEKGAVATAGLGSWDSRVFRASAWSPVTEHLRLKAELGYSDSDGYRDNSGYRARIANASAEGDFSGAKWTLGAGLDASTFEYPGSIDTATYHSNPQACGYFDPENYHGKATGAHAESSLALKGDDSELRTDLAYNRRDMWWNLGKWTCAENTLETWSLAPRLKKEFGEHWSAEAGLDGEYDRLYTLRFSDMAHTTSLGYARLTRFFGAAYGALSWKSQGEKPLTIDLAGRLQEAKLEGAIHDNTANLDTDKSGSDNALSLGATWMAAKNVRLWMRTDKFFRYPATDEVAAYSGYAMSSPFNKDLHSERGHGVEAGAEWGLPYLTLSATAFAQDVEGLIAYDWMKNLNVNLSDARRLGTELSAKVSLGEFRAGVTATWLDVTFTSGDYDGSDLYLIPHNQLSGYAEYTFGRLSARASVRYTGSQRQGGDSYNTMEKMPAYAVVDLTLRLRLTDTLHLYAAVDNLLDRRYATIEYYDYWYPAQERGYRAGIQWHY